MAKVIKVTKALLEKNFEKISSSTFYNPLYGKKFYFFDTCTPPKITRNQLLGYLGAFSESSLSSEIDICVVPFSSYQDLKDGFQNKVIEKLNNKLNSYNEEKDRNSNTIPNTLIISEKDLFKFVKSSLLGDDQVKIDQFERLDFTFEI